MNDTFYTMNEMEIPEISEHGSIRYLGYFPYKAILKKLNLESSFKLIEQMNQGLKPGFIYSGYEPGFFYNCLCALIYAQIIASHEEYLTITKTLPRLFEEFDYEKWEILDCLTFLGFYQEEIIDVFTAQIDAVYSLDITSTHSTGIFYNMEYEFGPAYEGKSDIYCSVLADKNDIPAGLFVQLTDFYKDYVQSGNLQKSEKEYFKNRIVNGRNVGRLYRRKAKNDNILIFGREYQIYDSDYFWNLDYECEHNPEFSCSAVWYSGLMVVCYMAMTLQRIFQHKILKNKFRPYQIKDFTIKCRFVSDTDGTWINLREPSRLLDHMKDNYLLPLSTRNLENRDIQKILNFSMPDC